MTESEGTAGELARAHLRFGWWALLLYLSLGIALETLHGFKVQWYLDLAHTTRRMLWTLSPAHGVLLSIVNLVYARAAGRPSRWQPVASRMLRAATILLPGGFLLGGIGAQSGDAGLGILLVPVGAVCLFLAVLQTARSQ